MLWTEKKKQLSIICIIWGHEKKDSQFELFYHHYASKIIELNGV